MVALCNKFDELSEVSKIRRFIYSDLKNLSLFDVYNTYWLDMEEVFLSTSEKLNENLLEKFLIDYLTIQNSAIIPKKENLFKEFLNFYQRISKFQNRSLIIKNIYRYSVYYIRLIFADLKDDEIRKKIKKINALKATDAYPFLMEVFEDFEFAHINRSMLLEILDTVLGFIDERNSKKPSQIALSFAGLSSEINKMLILKDYTPHFVIDRIDTINDNLTINSINKT